MPELPDLEVFGSNLHKQLTGAILKKVQLSGRAKSNVSATELKKSLENKKLTKVYREGKELRFAFGKKTLLGMHLMLHGKLHWMEAANPLPHILLLLSFNNKKRLVLTDFQSNARVTLNPKEAEAPDALSKQVNLAFWKKSLASKATIKNLLLDQQVLRGIGNAYADEILWQAGISPFSVSNKIPPVKIKALAKAVRSVLKNAEKQVRKKEPGIIGGELRDFLLIHNSKKKASPQGAKILHKTSGSRKTYYTKEQELFK